MNFTRERVRLKEALVPPLTQRELTFHVRVHPCVHTVYQLNVVEALAAFFDTYNRNNIEQDVSSCIQLMKAFVAETSHHCLIHLLRISCSRLFCLYVCVSLIQLVCL